jgi:hypothetical protein
MSSDVLVNLCNFSLENKCTRLANVILAPSTPVEEGVILESILFTEVAPGVAIVLRHCSDVSGEAMRTVTSDAFEAAITRLMLHVLKR